MSENILRNTIFPVVRADRERVVAQGFPTDGPVFWGGRENGVCGNYLPRKAKLHSLNKARSRCIRPVFRPLGLFFAALLMGPATSGMGPIFMHCAYFIRRQYGTQFCISWPENLAARRHGRGSLRGGPGSRWVSRCDACRDLGTVPRSRARFPNARAMRAPRKSKLGRIENPNQNRQTKTLTPNCETMHRAAQEGSEEPNPPTNLTKKGIMALQDPPCKSSKVKLSWENGFPKTTVYGKLGV
jgi:hypothetical protein